MEPISKKIEHTCDILVHNLSIPKLQQVVSSRNYELTTQKN